jgi:ubiquinone/menaquinone biosynthesis C-methylase UbiE
MFTNKQIKSIVKEKYGEIAKKSAAKEPAACCGPTCCSDDATVTVSEDYTHLKGYAPEADLGLGCGVPTEFAKMKEGDTVLDLGSGAGNDCFVARAIVGEKGKVIGVDMTEQMIAKARLNAEKLRYNNVEFRLGDIEELPVNDNLVDVIISNCVLNLVPDKVKAFSQIYRTLKPGGHFSISDIVYEGVLPEEIRSAAEAYVGCIAGAVQKHQYLAYLKAAGFENITIQKERLIEIDEDLVRKFLTNKQIEKLKENPPKVFSITVYGEKNNRLN